MTSLFTSIRVVCFVSALSVLTSAVTLDVMFMTAAADPEYELLYVYTFDPAQPPLLGASVVGNVSNVLLLHALSDDDLFVTPPSRYRHDDEWIINYSSSNAQQFIKFNTTTRLVTVNSPMPMLHLSSAEFSDITATYDHLIFMERQQTQYAISAVELGSSDIDAVFLQIYVNATTPFYGSENVPINPPLTYNQTITSKNGANQVMDYGTFAADQDKLLIYIPIVDVYANINTIYVYDVSQPYNIQQLPPINYTYYYGTTNILSLFHSRKLNKLLAANYIMTSPPGRNEQFILQITAVDVTTGKVTVLVDNVPQPLHSFICNHAYDDDTGNWYCVCYGGTDENIQTWSVYANVFNGQTSQPISLNFDDFIIDVSLTPSTNKAKTANQ